MVQSTEVSRALMDIIIRLNRLVKIKQVQNLFEIKISIFKKRKEIGKDYYYRKTYPVTHIPVNST